MLKFKNIDALVQDSSNCSALAMELLQSCPKSHRLDLCFNFAVVDYNIDAIAPHPFNFMLQQELGPHLFARVDFESRMEK